MDAASADQSVQLGGDKLHRRVGGVDSAAVVGGWVGGWGLGTFSLVVSLPFTITQAIPGIVHEFVAKKSRRAGWKDRDLPSDLLRLQVATLTLVYGLVTVVIYVTVASIIYGIFLPDLAKRSGTKFP